MARRFGRNQRRQMQERIVNLLAAQAEVHDYLREARDEARELRQRLEKWASEILHLMGPDHAFNEQLRRYRTANEFESRLHLRPVMRPAAFRSSEPVQVERVRDVIEACIMRCHIKSDDLGAMIAVEIGDHMGTLVGYGLPRDRRERWTPRDINYIATLIANKMADHLASEQSA